MIYHHHHEHNVLLTLIYLTLSLVICLYDPSFHVGPLNYTCVRKELLEISSSFSFNTRKSV